MIKKLKIGEDSKLIPLTKTESALYLLDIRILRR